MDMSPSVARTPLAPADLRVLTDQMTKGAITPLEACQRVMAGGVLLTQDAEIFFGEVFKRGGSTAADLILDHLSVLRIGYTSIATARYLGTLLLDYATDPDVARKILSWFPDFVDVSGVLEYLSVQDETDAHFYRELLYTFATDPQTQAGDARVSHLLMAILYRTPEWIGYIFSRLEGVHTEIDLARVLVAAGEIDVATHVLYPHLSLLGRIALDWDGLVRWVLQTYPNRRVEAVSALLEGASRGRTAMDNVCVDLAKEVKQEELPAFLQLVERQYQDEGWPSALMLELLKNRHLSLNILVDSQRSFSFYRNVVKQLSLIADQSASETKTMDVKQLLTRIVDDVHIARLDAAAYSVLLYEVARRKGEGDLNELRIRLLERMDFVHAPLVHSAFFEPLRGYALDPLHAQRLLEKIIRHGTYPFHERAFLLQVLDAVDEEAFHQFVVRYSQGIFSSAQEAEMFYLALAETAPERFAPIYLVHRRTFRRTFAQHSDADKRIYAASLPYVAFWRRIQSFLLG